MNRRQVLKAIGISGVFPTTAIPLDFENGFPAPEVIYKPKGTIDCIEEMARLSWKVRFKGKQYSNFIFFNKNLEEAPQDQVSRAFNALQTNYEQSMRVIMGFSPDAETVSADSC